MFNTEDIYNENAKKWLRLEPSSLSDFTARPLVFDECGDVRGKSILDIGCGEGYCARELKRRGADYYLGIDLSEQMIRAAQAQEAQHSLDINFEAANVVEYQPSRKFDLCVAVFLFNYLRVDEMEKVLSMVHEALLPGGEFVFSVPHPLFPFVKKERSQPFYFESESKDYFSSVNDQLEGKIWKQNGEPLHVQCVHKTFEDYFSSMRRVGFEKMPIVRELTVTQELVEQNKAFFSPLLNVPLHVLFKITK